jgi:phosphate transport system substrate-binding protein
VLGELVYASPLALGAGSTFVYPVLARWAEAYEAMTGVTIDYQAVGSGVGIRQIKSRTVDFGASDAPLRPDELAAAGLIQFPIVVGGVAPVVNVDGIGPGQLRLTGSVLADIYLGKIAKWNAGPIRELNRVLRCPIRPSFRSIAPMGPAPRSSSRTIWRGSAPRGETRSA